MGIKKDHVIIGTFDLAADAKYAIRDLRNANFTDKQIGLLTHNAGGDTEVTSFKELEGNKAAKGAAIGAAAGAGSGALWALGVAAGFLPAIGPILAGGILVAIAASAAAGAGAGVVVGTLVGLGVTDEEAAYYDDEFKKGRTIVVVQTDQRVDLAETILNGHNAKAREAVIPATLGEQIVAERRT